ncbi:uncharacterized protein HMPREF1541_00128 [Cyphellophora europaea CBS 101466]|uniref:Antigenic thaumatin-like protein n=1 Tax=Cyphellophora europaea (strain CBS 101466) TaxID=1220924 RepID=W2SB49_CYPE1|nr:uncharacterized protein HMPREF1541_00128 [Cyphellophora europaea CBS 101466]ETN45946.1 hypothetical protein HMPREF1541_00128 [Cyphellophora europaea CBS 101466]
MSLSKFTGAAVLLALAPTAMALGQATVVNNCGFPIYYASVGQSQHAEMQQMQGSYSEQFGEQGNGISIKLAPSADANPTQFEFTWADGKINYDLSNINGNPFANEGMSLVPSMSNDPNNPTCVPINCAAGDSVCDAAYNQPDDVRTHVCSDNADLVLTMCPGGSSGTPSSSGSSSGSETSTASPSASAVASSAPAASSTTTWGGRPPSKRAEHGHQRVHSRAFRV